MHAQTLVRFASDRRGGWSGWSGDLRFAGVQCGERRPGWSWRCAMGSRLLTVNDILAGHVTLDVECLDRIYLNGYVPNLQVGGQVLQFLTKQGFPIPSPAVIGKIGDRFRE